MSTKINWVFICFLIIIYYKVGSSSEKNEIKRDRKLVPRRTSILDTGKGAIGLFLGRSVKNLKPLRKHYYWRIHHNYHNIDNVLQEVLILPKDITLCEGDAGKFCPLGSKALCTKNGAVRCLTILWETESCAESFLSDCAKVSLPCDIYTPECRLNSKEYFDVKLRCISMVNVYANLIVVNRSMIAQDLIKKYPPHFFCQTIMALPAKLTKGEEVFCKTNNIFGQFAVKALGIGR